ncbi:YraN family protein [Beijerinckia sp. L45]|uniref:YraN family protein n=1 Tax=Beijerinckia sp. L45 TaxID=1641855 RepID=UPI00131B5E79|nr:YraN family protein [Beijerinckia sp. L45]
MRRSRADRQRAHRAGHGAEWAAILYLRCKGYRIIARRYTIKGGEIDIVARRGDALAFVEVKLRSSLDSARIAIEPAKRRRMARAARAFLANQAYATRLTLRADAIYLAPWRWPLHIPAAFELDID